jgi:Tfp pilus assembly ATPase PilU
LRKLISLKEALKNADSKNNLRLRIILDKKKSKKGDAENPLSRLSLAPMDEENTKDKPFD